MGVSDLKLRMADVPGIHSLTMGLEAGRILLRWGNGYVATADAAASDHEIETAIRNAIQLAPVSSISDKPAAPVAPSPAPASNAQEGKPVNSPTVTSSGSFAAEVREMIEGHKADMDALMQASKEHMRAGMEKQLRAAKALGKMAGDVHSAGDEMLAMMGQYTNDL